MPSPFPGMDPYIEAPDVWSDFHGGLAAEIRRDLNQRLRPRYVARMVPYVTYEQIELGPQELPLRLYSVEIHAAETMELVTAIEILSPVNQRRSHDAYHEYQRKRRDLLRSSAHLLEIDLLRGGERPPLERPVPPAPYYVTLSRVGERPKVKVWPVQLWDRLPVLPVPLREPDPDAPLDLGALVAALYEHGGYDMLIDYRRPPPPPKLSEAEANWLDEQLQKQGQR